ncbi:hypothetical protein HWV62_31841 [Athelia sp. TMB]|nr:hypothetical protein HWV62_31841 [Athelia sp. TMB]
MPPKLLQKHFTWIDVLLLPFRLVQVCVVTALMLVWNVFFVHTEEIIDKIDPQRHAYRPPIKPGPGVAGDVRSPCPAMNTLANHGFLPRSGRDIHPHTFIAAMQEGYNTSYALAAFLTWGGYILLGQWGKVSLGDLARHGCIEHSASVGHGDPLPGDEYAPTTWDKTYVQRLLDESSDGQGLRLRDFAMARVKREADYDKPLDALHAEIARGEMGLVLALFGRWVPKLFSDANAPMSPTISSPSCPMSFSHSAEVTLNSTDVSASTTSLSTSMGDSTTLSTRSSQATLVGATPSISPSISPSSSTFSSSDKPKPTLKAALDALKDTLEKPLHPLSPPSKTVYTASGEKEELELSVPLGLVRYWWTHEQLPAGFRTASMVFQADGSVDSYAGGSYGLRTQKELGAGVPTGEGRTVTGFLEIVRLAMGLKKAMADIRREGI